ncbi:MAG: hypothetical protein HYZ15_01115 [Sphingobacteriales bacterium]|nr:hypothetical protein [Sphingobacteriales bacterium]
MRKIYLLSILFIFSACKYEKNKAQNNDIAKIGNDSLRIKIMGKWGGKEGGPVFEIRKDSIYYYGKDSSYLYKLEGDTFSVKFNKIDSFTLFGKLRVSHDTLRIIEYQAYNQVTYAYRH